MEKILAVASPARCRAIDRVCVQESDGELSSGISKTLCKGHPAGRPNASMCVGQQSWLAYHETPWSPRKNGALDPVRASSVPGGYCGGDKNGEPRASDISRPVRRAHSRRAGLSGKEDYVQNRPSKRSNHWWRIFAAARRRDRGWRWVTPDHPLIFHIRIPTL